MSWATLDDEPLCTCGHLEGSHDGVVFPRGKCRWCSCRLFVKKVAA